MTKAAKYAEVVSKVSLTSAGMKGSSELKPIDLLEEFDSINNDDERTKHVYAAHGLASYFAQCLEAGLVNAAVPVARAFGEIYFRHEADDFETQFSRKTLGGMLNKIRKCVDVDSEATAILERALNARNQLAHGFYYKHATKFMNKPGQREIVNELCEMIALFRTADLLSDCLKTCLMEVFGIPRSAIDKEFQRMKAAAMSATM